MLVDALDTQILDVLKKDARTSCRKMAQMMGVTTPTIIARIRKLEDAGIIEGFSIKVRGEPFDGILFVISGRKARSLKKRMEQMEGVKNVMSTSDGALLVLSEPGASKCVRGACKGHKVKVASHDITSHTTHHGIKALCAYCRRPMEDALTVTLGKRRYYVCCPVCTRAICDRYEKLKVRARRKG